MLRLQFIDFYSDIQLSIFVVNSFVLHTYKKKKKLRLGGDTNPASSDSSQCTPSVPEPSLDECGRDTASAKPSVYPPENYRKKSIFQLNFIVISCLFGSEATQTHEISLET